MRTATPSVARRVAGLVVTLLVSAATLAPAFHIDPTGDLLCRPGTRSSELTVRAADDGVESHCDVCHWLRSLRVHDATDAGLTHGVDVERIASVPDVRPAELQFRSPGTSRAPPLA
jgi:hypothetical protein